LFEKSSDTVGLHLKNNYSEQELDENSTAHFFSEVEKEGERKIKRNFKINNHDAIISVGYGINSKKGI
jgi:hypothetical protein